jgi:hypothetical protein
MLLDKLTILHFVSFIVTFYRELFEAKIGTQATVMKGLETLCWLAYCFWII